MGLSQGAWEGFVAEGLQRSWEMDPRGLDPEMITKLRDVVERRFSEMTARFEASLADRVAQFKAGLANRVRDEVKKEWHGKVEVEEVGFVEQIVEPDTKLAEQLEVVAEDIPNLVDAGTKVGFHD